MDRQADHQSPHPFRDLGNNLQGERRLQEQGRYFDGNPSGVADFRSPSEVSGGFRRWRSGARDVALARFPEDKLIHHKRPAYC